MLWLLMLTLFAGSVLVGAIQENRIIKEYDAFVEQGVELSQLPFVIQILDIELENYIIFNREGAFEKYQSHAQILEDTLKKFDGVSGSDEYRFYLRTLSNMYRNIDSFAQGENNANIFNTFYNPQMGIKTQTKFLILQAEKLALSYLKYSSLHYRDVLIRYREIVMVRNGILLIAFVLISIWILRRGGDMLLDMENVSKNALILAEGNWDVADIDESRFYEINNIILAFNMMKLNIKNYIEKLAEKAEIERNYFLEKLHNAEKDKTIKETKLLALQMEINPHFLFNTLNTIGRTALLEDTESTIKLVESVSNIMRYSMRSEAHTANLSEELDALESYLSIQRLRFKNKLVFNLEVDSSIKLESVLIPPLILQPIVENAIIHGMSSVTKGGVIGILISKKIDSVMICIKDNGKGIEKALLDTINRGESIQIRQEEKSIGVENVKLRMHHYYGEDGLVTYNSVRDEGTTVLIRIPMKGSVS
ncbi:sensor histidine kinase [Cellulosilyticum sp. I15G10I2]|uniref:sensor histidine kinase n=1 Tax=Cellulosilyticum sp. I15G10I2 TaxID=1892843 RepID=UPI00085CC958|nr:histidine kinase [Cellulosilyticum sp. I15G10I2]